MVKQPFRILNREFARVVMKFSDRVWFESWKEFGFSKRANRIAKRRNIKKKRPLMVSAYKARDYERAYSLLREICKSKFRRHSDLKRRIVALERMGRSDLVRRYERMVLYLAQQPGADLAECGVRLWACGNFTAALSCLGSPEEWQRTDGRAELVVLSLVELRRYPEARRILEGDWEINLQAKSVEKLEKISAFLDQKDLVVPEQEDITPAIVSHWLEEELLEGKISYDPKAKSIMLFVHSLAIGGSERQAMNLIEGLCADKEVSAVHLVQKNPNPERERYDIKVPSNKLSVHNLSDFSDHSGSTWRKGDLGKEISGLADELGLKTLPSILNAIETIRPEVIHSRGGSHGEIALAGVLTKVPRVVVHFGSMSRGQQSTGTDRAILRERLVENIISRCAAFPNLVLVANSRAAANDWAKECGLPEERFGVIYNAIDPNSIGAAALATPQFSQRTPYMVGGVFRFSPVKDPLLWVEVAKRVSQSIPDTKFLLVGDGPMRSTVEAAIDAAGLREQFVLPGFVTENLIEQLRRMDVFLLTTQTESLPNVVIEAQLAGLPVVAPDVGGISEAIAYEDSAKLTKRNVDALTEAVIESLKDLEWRSAVHQQAPPAILNKFSKHALVSAAKRAYGWKD